MDINCNPFYFDFAPVVAGIFFGGLFVIVMSGLICFWVSKANDEEKEEDEKKKRKEEKELKKS